MPSVFDPNKEESDNQQEAQQGQGTSLTGGSGGQLAGAGAGQNKGGGLANRKATNSGRFVNIQNYIKANQQGAERLGSGVESKVGQEFQKGQQELQSQAQTAGQGLQQQEQGLQQQQQNLQSAAQQLGAKEQFQPAFQNLQSALDFSKNTKGQGLANEAAIRQQADVVQGLGNLTKSDSGRQQLLKTTYQRPQYSTGQLNLDNVLLGASQGGAAALQRIQQQAPQLQQQLEQEKSAIGNRLGQLNTGLEQLGQQGQQTAQQGTEAIRQALQARLQQLQTQDLEARAGNQGLSDYAVDPGTVNARALVRGAPVQREFGGLEAVLNPEQLKQLGLAKFQSELDPNKQYTPEELNALSVRADTEQAGQLNQLLNLLGQQQVQVGPQLQAGQYQINPSDLNAFKSQFNQALTNVIDMPSLEAAQGNPLKDLNFAQVNNRPELASLRQQAIQQALNNLMTRSQAQNTQQSINQGSLFGRTGNRPI